MSVAPRLSAALTRCETELQSLAAEAMAGGDYTTARLGMELAEDLAEKRKRAGLNATAPPAIKTKIAAQSGPSETTKKFTGGQGKKNSASKKTTDTYPKFVRNGDKLIKVGWSKRNQEEYHHKAPRKAVEGFAAHLRKHTKAEQLFTIEDVTPVPDPENDGDLPHYQVYMAIAWLRSLDAMFKHGRNGYSVDHSAIDEKRLSKAWKKLPAQTF